MFLNSFTVYFPIQRVSGNLFYYNLIFVNLFLAGKFYLKIYFFYCIINEKYINNLRFEEDVNRSKFNLKCPKSGQLFDFYWCQFINSYFKQDGINSPVLEIWASQCLGSDRLPNSECFITQARSCCLPGTWEGNLIRGIADVCTVTLLYNVLVFVMFWTALLFRRTNPGMSFFRFQLLSMQWIIRVINNNLFRS